MALTLPQKHSHTPTPAPTAFPTARNPPQTAFTPPVTALQPLWDCPDGTPSPSSKALVGGGCGPVQWGYLGGGGVHEGVGLPVHLGLLRRGAEGCRRQGGAGRARRWSARHAHGGVRQRTGHELRDTDGSMGWRRAAAVQAKCCVGDPPS